MIFCALFLFSCKEQVNSWRVISPDQQLQMLLTTEKQGQENKLFYRVSSLNGDNEKLLLEDAPMGLSFESGEDFTENLKLVSASDPIEATETYELVTGKQRKISESYMLRVFTFESAQGDIIKINVKVFNDGVAFQYELPEPPKGKVEHEATGFHISDGATAWMQQYDTLTTWTPAYEKYYLNGIAAGSTSFNEEGWCFPALFESDSHWILLTEAGLDEPFYGIHLNAEAEGGVYTTRFPEESEALGLGSRSSTLPPNGKTPWRVAIVTADLQDLVESNIVTHLAASNKVEDISWIEPGKAAWEWWSSEGKVRYYDSLKTYVDLAAEMGWQYSLVDAHWDHMEGGSIEDLVAYANGKNVDLLVWYNSGGPNNEVPERPRDRVWDAEKRKAEFKKIHELGIKGIKVDFFQSDKAIVIQQYLDILEDAAANQLLVNFHGCTIPRGWRRTYPNLMTMESVRGAETYRFGSDYPANAPVQHTILPFNRGVIGAMDYTPVTFSNQKFPHMTTYAHELALAVLFETGLLHLADRADAYLNLPEAVQEYLKNVPVVWDEVKYLGGYPGKELVLARRSGDVWYVSGVNGEKTAKEIEVNLGAIKDTSYDYTLFADGNTAKEFKIEEKTSETGENLIVKVLPYGGFAMLVR